MSRLLASELCRTSPEDEAMIFLCERQLLYPLLHVDTSRYHLPHSHGAETCRGQHALEARLGFRISFFFHR